MTLMTIKHADQQVDVPPGRVGRPHGSLYGVVQRVGKQGVQVAGLKALQAAAVGHCIELHPPGLAEQSLLGEHHVQHLVTGVRPGVVEAGGVLRLLQRLPRQRVRGQLAQGRDLHSQLVAALVDDVHVLPRHLILLALPLVEQIQCFHLLLEIGFFEQFRLQVEQRQKVKLPDEGGAHNTHGPVQRLGTA